MCLHYFLLIYLNKDIYDVYPTDCQYFHVLNNRLWNQINPHNLLLGNSLNVFKIWMNLIINIIPYYVLHVSQLLVKCCNKSFFNFSFMGMFNHIIVVFVFVFFFNQRFLLKVHANAISDLLLFLAVHSDFPEHTCKTFPFLLGFQTNT